MYRIDKQGVTTMPSIPTAKDVKHFKTNTVLPDWWLNIVQEELRNVVVAAGLTPDKNDNSQVVTAIKLLAQQAYETRYRSPSYYVEYSAVGQYPTAPSGFTNPKTTYTIPSMGNVLVQRKRSRNHNSLYSMKLYNTIANTTIKMYVATLLGDGTSNPSSIYIYLDGVLKYSHTGLIQAGLNGDSIENYKVELTLPDANTEYLLQVVHTSPARSLQMLGNFFTGTGIVFKPYK